MEKEFEKEIGLLQKYKEQVKPPTAMLAKLLSFVPETSVTNFATIRYNFSMWKTLVVPAGVAIAAVVIVAFLAVRGNQPEIVNNPSEQVSQQQAEVPSGQVTENNADQVLVQTDSAIQDSISVMDQDLKAMDEIDSSQDNPNSI